MKLEGMTSLPWTTYGKNRGKALLFSYVGKWYVFMLADIKKSFVKFNLASFFSFVKEMLWVLLHSDEQLLVDPHQASRLIGFALVLNAAEAVPPLAVVPLVIVVEFHLPHRLKEASFGKLLRKTAERHNVVHCTFVVNQKKKKASTARLSVCMFFGGGKCQTREQWQSHTTRNWSKYYLDIFTHHIGQVLWTTSFYILNWDAQSSIWPVNVGVIHHR